MKHFWPRNFAQHMNSELIEWLRQHSTFNYFLLIYFNQKVKKEKNGLKLNYNNIILWLKRFMLKVEKEFLDL